MKSVAIILGRETLFVTNSSSLTHQTTIFIHKTERNNNNNSIHVKYKMKTSCNERVAGKRKKKFPLEKNNKSDALMKDDDGDDN